MRQLLSKPAARAVLAVAVIVVGSAGWWLGSPLFIDNEIDEAFPLAATDVIPDEMIREEVGTETDDEETPTADTPGAAEPGEVSPDQPTRPVALLSGSFAGADDFHLGSGTATIYELEDGTNVLRLEDFEVTNGPDQHVLLVPNGAPVERDDLTGYVDLGELKGNIGNQNYDIPVDADISDFGSIVIYCEPFHVLFASATLLP